MARSAPEYEESRARKGVSGNDARVVETETEAQQDVTGHGVRYVLLFGLGGVVLAFALIYAVFWG